MENLLNKIFPDKCIKCGRVGEILCDDCLSSCRILQNQICVVCDKPSIDGNTHEKCLNNYTPISMYCCFIYEDLIRECIKKSKYSQRKFSLLKRLSKEACDLSFESNLDFTDYIVVPIPISRSKYKVRGFNQAEIVADALCSKYRLRKNVDILYRKKETRLQHSLGRQARFKNLEDAFYAKEYLVKDKKILLVDDISTTGATFLEATKTLCLNKAKEIRCFALSKKLLNKL